MKVCSSCGVQRPLTEFYWTNRRNGEKARHSKCQPCRREQFKTYSKTPQGKQVKRAGILRRKYKMTEDEYQEILIAQGGVCAICREPETKVHRDGALCRLVVDHSHATGDVRALLCSFCNAGLGLFKDDPLRLLAAARYLDGPRAAKGQAAKTEALEKRIDPGAAA